MHQQFFKKNINIIIENGFHFLKKCLSYGLHKDSATKTLICILYSDYILLFQSQSSQMFNFNNFSIRGGNDSISLEGLRFIIFVYVSSPLECLRIMCYFFALIFLAKYSQGNFENKTHFILCLNYVQCLCMKYKTLNLNNKILNKANKPCSSVNALYLS